LYFNTTGFINTAIGHDVLVNNITGSENTASGSGALLNNSSGSKNTANGRFALCYNETGQYNTALGYSAFFGGTNRTNSTALGYDTEITASNQIRLGNAPVSSIGGFANWTNISDGRLKKNIQENISGLAFINKLRPVSYQLDMDAMAYFLGTPDSLRLFEAEAIKEAEIQTGFIAQEVELAADEVGFDFHGIDKPKNKESHYGIRYAEFVVPLVKGMQEQQAIIEEQNDIITKLKSDFENQKSEMDKITEQFNKIQKLLDSQFARTD